MAEGSDTGFELLPAQQTLSVDADLEAASSALFDTPLESLIDVDSPRPFGRGWAFNFETGQFVKGDGAAPRTVRGLEQLTVWIEKTLRTARFAHPIYSDDYGMEQPFGLIGQVFTPGVAGRYGAALEAALLVHDRITQVIDMTFTGGPESDVLAVTFTVITDEDELEFTNIPIGRVT